VNKWELLQDIPFAKAGEICTTDNEILVGWESEKFGCVTLRPKDHPQFFRRFFDKETALENDMRFQKILKIFTDRATQYGEKHRAQIRAILSGETEQEENKPNSVSEYTSAKLKKALCDATPILEGFRRCKERVEREMKSRERFLAWYAQRVPAIFRWLPSLKRIMLRSWLDSADKARIEKEFEDAVDLGEVSERNMKL